MISAPIAQNEAERLDALRQYEILDTPSSDEFDDFTRLELNDSAILTVNIGFSDILN